MVSLEARLNDFDADVRAQALEALAAQAAQGSIALPPLGPDLNLHCHSFFSFNGYGLSPSALAWKGRKSGYCAMGLVDFDVLDGVEEFLKACELLGLRACAGLETRVFVPEFADRVINSPGEPGIAYHMGAGFVTDEVPNMALLGRFKEQAQTRNRGLVERVNAFLDPVRLDYECDVLPLTPRGNATERHVCTAYDVKAREMFPEAEARAGFWAEKLGTPAEKISAILEDGPALQGLIRSKTMKQGGPGYVRPEGGDFPLLEEMNQLVLEAGAIPTMAWLDGTTAGEQALEELLDVMVASGVAAVNIIPDRNWNLANADEKKLKVAKLNEYIAAVQARDLPIMVGTEMNAHGQRFVDDFSAPELAPHYAAFLEGAHILHAHTLLESQAGMGYCSGWAKEMFPRAKDKNTFFRAAGAAMQPAMSLPKDALAKASSPDEVLAVLAV